MMNKAITLLALLLIAGLAQAQPRAELEAWPLDDQGTWRIAIEIDEVSSLFGFQAKILFPQGNIEPLTKKIEHHEAWPKQGKIALRNFVKPDVSEYAVSLVRPAKPISLSGQILVMDVKLLEGKPTPIVIDTLKASDETGKVTKILPEKTAYMIGQKADIWPYIVYGVAAFIVLLGVIGIYRKRSAREPLATAAS